MTREVGDQSTHLVAAKFDIDRIRSGKPEGPQYGKLKLRCSCHFDIDLNEAKVGSSADGMMTAGSRFADGLRRFSMRYAATATWVLRTGLRSNVTPGLGHASVSAHGVFMIAFTIRRLIEGVMVMLSVALLAFVLFRFVGDPVNQMTGQDTSLEDRIQLRKDLGLDDPFATQFGRFVWNAARFDFGISYQVKQPVTTMIATRFPATLELAVSAAVLAIAMGVPMGVYTGIHRDTWLSKILLSVSLVGVSLPPFLIGILLIYVFAVTLGVLPSFGRGEIVRLGGWTTGFLTFSGIKSLVLPSFTLGLFQLTIIARLIRSQMLEVLRTDYIKFARARGLTDRAVHFGHALKNTLIPVITIIGLNLGALIAFAIITETVFQWPGMGLLFIQSVQNADIPVMAAYLLLVAFLFVSINFLVDLLYLVVDPRIRIVGREH